MPTRFIELAGEINVQMPGYVVEKLMLALNEQGKAIRGSKVLVLGVAYKKDIDDPRESPAFVIMERLGELGADLRYHDAHIPRLPRMRNWPHLEEMESMALSDETLSEMDAVLIVTDHSAVDYEQVVARSKLVVDTRGVVRKATLNVVKA
jgi:UDP-N-acetyl-D-glucosamine dehydrogenase